MKHLRRVGAGFLLIIALSIPALAGDMHAPRNPGETQTPPGETQSPPGETQGPPGATQNSVIAGDMFGPGIIALIVYLF